MLCNSVYRMHLLCPGKMLNVGFGQLGIDASDTSLLFQGH